MRVRYTYHGKERTGRLIKTDDLDGPSGRQESTGAVTHFWIEEDGHGMKCFRADKLESLAPDTGPAPEPTGPVDTTEGGALW